MKESYVSPEAKLLRFLPEEKLTTLTDEHVPGQTEEASMQDGDIHLDIRL